MDKIADAEFIGAPGIKYSFGVYSLDAKFENFGAVYVFTKRTVKGGEVTHSLLYIGQTKELYDRITSHEKWPCVQRRDVNCICVHADDDEDSRLKKERDLLYNYDPPCND